MNQREKFPNRSNNSKIIKNNINFHSSKIYNQKNKTNFYKNQNYDHYLNKILKDKLNNKYLLLENNMNRNLFERDYNFLIGNNFYRGIRNYGEEIYHKGNFDNTINRDILSDYNNELISRKKIIFPSRFSKNNNFKDEENNFREIERRNNRSFKEKKNEKFDQKNFNLNNILTLKLIDPNFDIVI